MIGSSDGDQKSRGIVKILLIPTQCRAYFSVSCCGGSLKSPTRAISCWSSWSRNNVMREVEKSEFSAAYPADQSGNFNQLTPDCEAISARSINDSDPGPVPNDQPNSPGEIPGAGSMTVKLVSFVNTGAPSRSSAARTR